MVKTRVQPYSSKRLLMSIILCALLIYFLKNPAGSGLHVTLRPRRWTAGCSEVLLLEPALLMLQLVLPALPHLVLL